MRHTGLRHKGVDLVRSKGAGQIVRRYGLVGAGADPRVCGVAMATLLELFEQVVQAAAQNASGSAAREKATQSTLEQIAETTTATFGARVGGASSRRRTRARRMGRRLPPGEALDGLKGE